MNFFITGISTDVGKTIASAVVTEALRCDYWKSIQAGELENTDTHKVRNLISNSKTKFHPEAFLLNSPVSPHLSAEIDNVSINVSEIIRPDTKNNHLVMEGAGGLLVPLNETETIADLILPKDKILLVSRHYLGSINHTLLTLEVLVNRGLDVAGIIFSGDKNLSTENIILHKSQVPMVGRIEEEAFFDKAIIKKYAKSFLSELTKIIE